MFTKRLLATTSIILAFCACLVPSIALADHPTIMVSIKPFYNLCAKIMQGVGEPKLLVKGNGSPHDYQLKPSDAKLINDADLIVWGGIGIDGYLSKSLGNLGETTTDRCLDLSEIKGLKLLALRHSAAWGHGDHNHDHGHGHDHSHVHYDAHFWLDPNNAILIGNAIAERLADLDPTNAKKYQQNAQELRREILSKEKIWLKALEPYQHIPYLVFHDAYQYFNAYFELDGVGAISLNPEIPPSAQRIDQINQLLLQEKIRCIFSEPQFNTKIIDSLTSNVDVYKGVLDPLGSDKDLGADGYFMLIDDLVDSFVLCGKSTLKSEHKP